MINLKNAKKLLNDIDKKLDEMECGTVTLKGVKNLSRSDLETLQMYAEFAMRDDLYSLSRLRGNCAEVWSKYNIGGVQ